MEDRIYARPDARLMFLEAPRMATEFASLVPMAPFLSTAPRGDGHPVLVLPGLGASDRSTRVLRRFLSSRGYQALPWGLGRNLGPAMIDLPGQLGNLLDQVYQDGGARKVSIVGWSLGGIYARVLAHMYPDRVRQVITLGSPFNGNPRSTRAYPIARRMAGGPLARNPTHSYRLMAGDPLPGVPSTAIFSKSDAIVPWQIASQPTSKIAENIEVYASHTGLGFNPTVFFAIADRLATKDGDWQPFRRTGWRRAAYGPARLPETH